MVMNRIYKVIWSRVRHCYVVVSELAKRAGKEKSTCLSTAGKKVAVLGLGAVLFMGSPCSEAFAATGNKIIGGSEESVTDAKGKKVTAAATGDYSTVSGGVANQAEGTYSSVSGGSKNQATGESASVSGGGDNVASGAKSSVSGGKQNKATGEFASVSGGDQNEAAGNQSTISGGTANKTTGDWSTIVGGAYNVTSGNSSLALGGMQSAVQGMYSVGIAGGSTSSSATQGFAAGYQSSANVDYGMALGYQAVANTKNTISFGHVAGDTYYASDPWDHTISTNTFKDTFYNRLVNVADGIDDHDVVVMEQLTKAKAEAVATAKNQIKVKGDETNVHAEETTDQDGVQTTTISLKPKVTLKDSTDTTGAKQVVLDGTAGTITAGLSTDASNYISLNGTTGLANIGAITIGKQPSYTYTYYVPVYDTNGNMTSRSATRTTESGNFITGLTNTTWTPGKYASGRAATEDQLEKTGRHFLSIKTGTSTDGTTVAENTLANYYNDGATGTYSLAFGVNTKSSGNYATSMGINSTASGLGAMAVGYNSTASGTQSIAVGTQNNASGNFSVALGVGSNAGTANTDTSSTTNGAAAAVGFMAQATKTGSSAYGYNARAVQDEGTALGVSSVANVEGGVAVGAHSIADVAKGAKGYLAGDGDRSTAWVSTAGAMSLGGNTKDENGNAITVSRQITNLAAGTNDTDAVNVAQLKAVESEGMNFQGNNTDTTVHMNQGGTLQIQGTGTKTASEYSGENILVTGINTTSDDGKTVTTKLNIGLDKNIRVDSVTAGQATTSSVQGYAGSVKIVGASGDSTKYEATSLTTAYDTAAKSVNDATINRLQYTDGDGATKHTVATLEDGLKLAGDTGSGTVSLDSTLAVTGGETNASKLSSGNNIGVTASNGTLKLQLAKDLTGLSSVAAGTVVMGSQTDGTNTGNYLTGLDNKTWAVGTTKAVSGRAATEDQLQSVADVVDTNRTNIATNTADIAKGLNFTTNTTDVSSTTGYKVVNKALGATVSIKAHDAQSGHTYKTDNLTTSIDNSGNITIAMDTQLTADKVTVGTGSNALTLDGSKGTLTTGSSTLNGTGLTIAGGPSLTTSGISGGSKQITSVASGANGVDNAGKAVYNITDNAANIGDVKAIAAQMVTVSQDSSIKKNTKVTKTTKTDGTVDYEVALNDTLTLGDNNYAVLNGTAGTLSLGNLLFLDGSNGYGTIGSLHLGNYSGTGSSWTLTDNKNGTVAAGTYLTGLTNTSWNTTDPTYVSGRAATEDELAAVSSTVNSGWKAKINGTDVKTVTPSSNTLNFVAGNNIALAQNGDIEIATTPDVNFTTVRVGGTKGIDGTYTGGIYMGSQAGGGANSGTGFYITGLQNTNWDANSIVSGRAATEDQLQKAINEVQTGTLASDNYVTGGVATDDTDNPGQLKVTLNEKNGNSASVSGLHDYYVTAGSVSTGTKTNADGTTSTSATLTLTKNNNSTVAVDLSGLSNMDYHLVENSASGSDGKYSVDANGDVKLTVASPTDTTGKEITISGLASKTALEQGLTFTASAMADGATSLTHKAQLGDTIGIYGGSKQNGHTYNTNNITTTISDKGDIRVLLDDNLTATSLTAGSKITGVDGSVMATGQGGAYLKLNGADGSLRMGDSRGNFAAMVQNYGGPRFLDSTALGSPRIQYWAASAGQSESDASQTLYTLATLNDGFQLAGDSGIGSVALDKTLTVKGGEDSSSDLASGSNIGVTASGSTLQLQLAKQLTGLTSIALGNNMILGNQASGSATGDYLTGLDNTTWSGTPVSGRAATEDQLASVSTSLKNKTTGGFGLTADAADSTTGSKDVKQDLGSTIRITTANDDNLTTTADAANTAIKLALSKNLTLTSAAFTDGAGNTTTVNGTGITIAKTGTTSSVSLTNGGLDNGGNQIVDVASGLGTTTLADATGDMLNHGATIGDLKKAASGLTASTSTLGLNFKGNSNPTDTTGAATALHANLGDTVSILGTGTNGDDSYSARNVKVINKNNALYVELDKDMEVRSLQAGYGENGNNVQGQLLLYGANSDNTYSNLVLESQYMDEKPYLTNTTSTGDKRLVYKDGENGTELHTVATMSDGLKFSDDNGSSAAITLGSTLTVTGGAAKDKLAKDPNGKLVAGNIGVVAAENSDGTSGSLTLALAKDVDLGAQGSLTANGTVLGYQTATTKVGQTNETGNYVTGLTNTVWSGTDYVSGRAATEDQLNAVSQSIQNAVNSATFSITAGGQGEATDATITEKVGGAIRIFGDAPRVSGGGDGDGWDRSKANILTKVKKDNHGDDYISVELQDNLEVGVHAGTDTDGTAVAGVDGSMLFKGAAAADEVNITGDTGVTLNYNGSKAAALRQSNGAGYLDLTGTTAGTSATLSAQSGTALAGKDMTRTVYTDQSGQVHQLATLEDGLILTGDSGTVTRLLNSTLKLSGGVKDTASLSTDANIGVVANTAGDGLDIRLAKNLTGIESITGLTNTTITSADFATKGRAATEEQLKQAMSSVTTVTSGGGFGLTDNKGNAVKADLGNTIGVHGDSNITTSVSDDGKSINIKLKNQVNLGDEGSITAGGVTISKDGINAGNKQIKDVASGIGNVYDTTKEGQKNWNNAANIGDVKQLAGEAAKGAVDSLGTRDFTGDDRETISRKLGETMKLSGGADTTKLTDGNIGVVKNANGDGLDIKLSSELKGLTSVTTGNSTLNNDGLTINSSTGADGTTLTSSGIKIAANGEGTHNVEISSSNVSMGGQQIHDVAPGTAPTDAVNVSQLGGVVSGVNNAITRLDSRVDRVGAGASALAALHPLEFDPEDKLNFAAGFGHYRSANAAAIGAFYQPTESVRFNVGGSFGGGENMVNAGVTFSLDPKRRDRFQSRIVLMRTVQQLRSDNETLRQDNQKVHAQLDAMNDRLNKLTALVEQLSAKQ